MSERTGTVRPVPADPDRRPVKRRLLVAALSVAGSLLLAIVLSGLAIGLATAVSDGWDEIGMMLVFSVLLFPAWCAGSLIGLRHACRRWLGTDPRLRLLIGLGAAGAAVGTGVAWLAAAGVVPGGPWGPIVYGPAAAVATLAVLLRGAQPSG